MIRPVKIRHYLAFMSSRGVGAEEVLLGSGITVEKLQDPRYLIDLQQSERVVSNIIQLTGDQGIGFDIGKSSRLTEMGIIGHALISTRTVRDTLNLWIAYSNSLLGIMSHVAIEDGIKGQWTMVISQLAPMGFIFNFCVEELLMTTATLSSVLAEEPLVPIDLELSYPAPSHHDLYRQHYTCPIRFNSRRTSITFRSPSLDTKRNSDDQAFNQLCLLQCTQLAQEIEGKVCLATRVRNVLARSSGTPPSLTAAAKALGIGERTLRRKLDDEGTSFKELVAEVRHELAIEYLCNSNMPLAPKQVASLLGFKDTNAFRRAFKSWTGKTVGDFCSDARSSPTAGHPLTHLERRHAADNVSAV